MRLLVLLVAACAAYAQYIPADIYATRSVVSELLTSCESATDALVDSHCADDYQATTSFEINGVCQEQDAADCKATAFDAVNGLFDRAAGAAFYRPDFLLASIANHPGIATTKYTLNCFTTIFNTLPLSLVALERYEAENRACPYGVVADFDLKTLNVSAPLTPFESASWVFAQMTVETYEEYQTQISTLDTLLNASFPSLTLFILRTEPDIFLTNLETFVPLDVHACADRFASAMSSFPVSPLNLHLNRTDAVALSLAVVHSVSAGDLASIGNTDWVLLEWITPNILNADDLPARAQALCDAVHKFANSLPPECDEACFGGPPVATVCNPEVCFPTKGHLALSAYLPWGAEMCDVSDVELDALQSITLEGFVTGRVHFRSSSALSSIAVEGCNMNFTFFEDATTTMFFLVSLELEDVCDTESAAPQLNPYAFYSLKRLRMKAGPLVLDPEAKNFDNLELCDLHNVVLNFTAPAGVCDTLCSFHASEEDYGTVRCEADDTTFDVLDLVHTVCGRNVICCTVAGATDIADVMTLYLNAATDSEANNAQEFYSTSDEDIGEVPVVLQLTFADQLLNYLEHINYRTMTAAHAVNPYCVFNSLFVDVLNVGTGPTQVAELPPSAPFHKFILRNVSTDDLGTHLLYTIDNFVSSTTISPDVSMLKLLSITPMINDDGLSSIGEFTSYSQMHDSGLIPNLNTVMYVVDELFGLSVSASEENAQLHCAFVQLLKGRSMRSVSWYQEFDATTCQNITALVDETVVAIQSNSELLSLSIHGTAANPVPLTRLLQLPHNNNPRPSKLEVLDLDYVSINSTLDSHFATMYGRLQLILLTNCELTGSVPALPDAPVISFKNNPELTGNLTSVLSHTTNYTHIDFSNTGVTGALLPSMALCLSAVECTVPLAVDITGCAACSH